MAQPNFNYRPMSPMERLVHYLGQGLLGGGSAQGDSGDRYPAGNQLRDGAFDDQMIQRNLPSGSDDPMPALVTLPPEGMVSDDSGYAYQYAPASSQGRVPDDRLVPDSREGDYYNPAARAAKIGPPLPDTYRPETLAEMLGGLLTKGAPYVRNEARQEIDDAKARNSPPKKRGEYQPISDVSPKEIARRKQAMGSFADEPLANPSPQQPQGISRDERLQMLIEGIRHEMSLSNAGTSGALIQRLHALIAGGQ